MKLSILTVANNKASKLKDIYESLLINLKYPLDVEWLIMDDGSEDRTKNIVEEFIKERYIEIKYFYQENQGNTIAINNLMEYVKGDWILNCNPDDYLSSNAFEIIDKKVKLIEDDLNIYALSFLKCDMYGDVSGNEFPKDGAKTKAFDLYYKDEIKGEKIFLFNAKIRNKYKHVLEINEKYITPKRMLHKIDKNYNLICFNMPIIIGDITNVEDDIKRFIENPLRILQILS